MARGEVLSRARAAKPAPVLCIAPDKKFEELFCFDETWAPPPRVVPRDGSISFRRKGAGKIHGKFIF